MALFFADLVREQSWAAGSGALALGGALPRHRRFADAVPAGAHFHYAIAGVTRPDEWETGEGAIGPGGLLERTPIASSAGGAAVDFSAGLKTVALTVGAAWYAAQEAGAAVGIGQVTGLQGALDAKQPLDAAVTALADLDAAPGIVEQTGSDAFSKRATGVGAATSILTRGDGDGRYAPAVHGHAIGDVAGLQSALDAKLSGSQATAFGLSLLDDANAAAGRATLGLGSAAVKATGTSGDAVPVLNGPAASWASGASFGGPVNSGGFKDSGPYVARFEGSGAAVPPGSSGVGFELYTSGGAGYLQAYNRTIPGAAPLTIAGSAVNIDIGAVRRASFGAAGVDVAGIVSISGAQVVAARRTGWSAATGAASRATFDTASATTSQLAERLKALIDDLSAHGLIGS